MAISKFCFYGANVVVAVGFCVMLGQTYRSFNTIQTYQTANGTTGYNQQSSAIRDAFSSALSDEVFAFNPQKRLAAVKAIHSNDVDCAALFKGQSSEQRKTIDLQKQKHHDPHEDSRLSNLASDCHSFIKDRGYIMSPLSKEEAEFPIAYSIMMYKQAAMAERLLRAIYRPQNVYCIHVDAPIVVQEAMLAVARCFNNVFVARKQIRVAWGEYTQLEAEISCLKDLWKYSSWKYFINLTGEEFPLQTNLDIVRILKVLNGTNNVALEPFYKFIKNRTKYVHKKHKNLMIPKSPPPANYTLAKGSTHVVLKRAFVDYVLHNEQAIRYRKWLADTKFPEETFFQALHYSPHMGVPGAYTGKLDKMRISSEVPHIARLKLWDYNRKVKCQGKYVRKICIYSIYDLPFLSSQKQMFVNKFNWDYHPLAYDCLEELVNNRTRQDLTGERTFDEKFYNRFGFIRKHID